MKCRPLAPSGHLAWLAAAMLALAAPPALAWGDPPLDLPPFIAYVQVGRPGCITCPPRACPGEGAQVQISGNLPACYRFGGLHRLPVRSAIPVLVADFLVDTCAVGCPDLLVPFSGSFTLPPEGAGSHAFLLRNAVRTCPDTTVVVDSTQIRVTYDVFPYCPPEDVPVDSLVRTFVSLRTVPEHPCAGDSVTLQLVENGCPPCVSLRSFGLSPAESTIAGVIDWTPVCMEFRCASDTLSMSLGRLNAGTYRVLTSMTVVVHDVPNPDSTIHFQLPIQFEVGRLCGPQGPCVTREMFSNVPPHQCELTLRPGQAGDVPLYYESQLPMAAVEGSIEVPLPFQLADLRLASHLTGVHLVRQRHTGGFRWLVFCDPGVTLPAGARQHLLVATVAALPEAANGASELMTTRITLASDAAGNELPLCVRETLDFVVVATRLCVAGEPTLCDVNSDGRLDVRDLVRMVTCLDSLPHNTRDASPCRDCNADGTFDLSDIFCCAGHILRGPLVPRDSVVSDGRLQVSFDPPEPSGDGWFVRVHVRGASALGAAVLRLEYPGDRWRVQQAMVRDPGPLPVNADWYVLADVDQPGRVHLGGLRVAMEVIHAGQTGSGDDLVFYLLVSPIGAPQAGDRLAVVGADLAARNGAVLTPTSALPSLPLDGTAPPSTRVSLSSPRPNPFTSSTQFVVTLPSAGQLDLAVHDLAGRRVATIATGRYGPGQHPFSWNGAGAHDGLYFVRLTVNGQVLSTRVAMLRDTR